MAFEDKKPNKGPDCTMADARNVANAILLESKSHGRELTPIQLLKLAYIAHGWMLALYDRPLIHQPVKAWLYGPIIPDIYYALKSYGAVTVPDSLAAVPANSATTNDLLDDFERNIIQQVIDHYGEWNGIALSKWAHQPGSPWDLTWSESGNDSTIPNERIATYFKTMIRSASEIGD